MIEVKKMKTFMRRWYERSYNSMTWLLEKYGITSFEQLLSAGPEEMLKVRNALEGITVNGYKGNLITENLLEMNQYGSALKFYVSDDFVADSSLQEAFTEIRAFKEGRAVSVTADNHAVVLYKAGVTFEFGKYRYEALRVLVIDGDEYTPVFIPKDDSVRYFVPSYNEVCERCTKKQCIWGSRPSKLVFEPLVSGYDSLSSKHFLYDLHASQCDTAEKVRNAVVVLGTALKQYREYSTTEDSKRKAASKSREGLDSGSRDSKSGSSKDNEYFVQIGSKVAIDMDSVSRGTHATPVCHQVNGYWRKRSRQDPTMIFVKSFARGGTEDQRKNLKIADGFTSQKVIKLNGGN